MTTAAHQSATTALALAAALAHFASSGGSVSLGHNKTALVVCMAALLVGGAWADSSPAMAATADDLVIGEEACSSRWDANCDGDTMDEVLFWLVLWIWRGYKLYACARSVRAAAVWLTGTAFFIDARRRASSFLLRRGGAALRAAARMPPLGGLGGGGGVAVPPIMRNLEEKEDDVELAVISPRSPVAAAAVAEQHPLPLPQ
ncbi:expressed unknown protein [Ectocarpus siliculosus]|uniref:Uncharacterized protein n=1 Tax=Ectocarpus siliculosus TaxID=2880 RepID=D7G965_ECTSI|nr:expressed unknown protein [Ectocarpus siliculosus]|eukprot:CBJ28229.1 expressed unknown protein [Ectocarpus siliculosus]